MTLTREPAVFVGVDMAWGKRKPDGIFCFVWDGKKLRAWDCFLSHGDESLLANILSLTGGYDRGVIAIDAPLIIKNKRGMRPVDKLTHALYRKEHAGCHPAYLDKINRPVVIANRLKQVGFPVTPDVLPSGVSVIEVYPHISTLHVFGLTRILKYKKGCVSDRKREFARYQKLLRLSLKSFFFCVELSSELERFMKLSPWNKNLEDQTDAMLCALTAWHHWVTRGQGTEVLGDRRTGFIVSCARRFYIR